MHAHVAFIRRLNARRYHQPNRAKVHAAHRALTRGARWLSTGGPPVGEEAGEPPAGGDAGGRQPAWTYAVSPRVASHSS